MSPEKTAMSPEKTVMSAWAWILRVGGVLVLLLVLVIGRIDVLRVDASFCQRRPA